MKYTALKKPKIYRQTALHQSEILDEGKEYFFQIESQMNFDGNKLGSRNKKKYKEVKEKE